MTQFTPQPILDVVNIKGGIFKLLDGNYFVTVQKLVKGKHMLSFLLKHNEEPLYLVCFGTKEVNVENNYTIQYGGEIECNLQRALKVLEDVLKGHTFEVEHEQPNPQ